MLGAFANTFCSCCKWSSGHNTEHSIANAYISAIHEARHFIYIENQFFITATSDQQRPVTNKIGGAMVDRIMRAYNAHEDFKIIIIMPAVPAFAGDLQSDGALGTRAIMEFQYASICRGGNSIIESLQRQGVTNWKRYISFYNLRNYDRINVSSTMREAEQRAGVSYEQARKEHDDSVGAGFYPRGERTDRNEYNEDRGGRGNGDRRRVRIEEGGDVRLHGAAIVGHEGRRQRQGAHQDASLVRRENDV